MGLYKLLQKSKIILYDVQYKWNDNPPPTDHTNLDFSQKYSSRAMKTIKQYNSPFQHPHGAATQYYLWSKIQWTEKSQT